MMWYNWKVRSLKTRYGNFLWRYWRGWRGDDTGGRDRLIQYTRTFARGCTFVDIGCMWGVHGEYSFLAEEAGAKSVKAVDVYGPTEEFEARRRSRNSSVEFVLGDATQPETISRVGVVDTVFCSGVLYHHPSPFDLLAALRQMCGKTLILRTATIPEIGGLPNAAVYFPMLAPEDRGLWNLSCLGVGQQVGITDAFEPHAGYGNWFWGLTPSSVASLLMTAGFRIDHRVNEPFLQTFICAPVDVPFQHRLPD